MTSYETILYEKQRQGVLITFNRPDKTNAMTDEMEAELHAALDEAEADPEIRAIVLTGAGKAYCSGYDMGGEPPHLEWPAGVPPGMSSGEWLTEWTDLNRVSAQRYRHLWQLSKPVIAAVNGWALGAGSWYALLPHMTFASERAVFAQPEVRFGGGSNFIWIFAAGFKNALRYALTGDHIDAQEALRIGIVNQVFPHDELLDECFKVVERIALVQPEAVSMNLFIGTKGLEMMGLRNAFDMNEMLQNMVLGTRYMPFNKKFFDATEQGGMREHLEVRDGPFWPEPFGPHAKKTAKGD